MMEHRRNQKGKKSYYFTSIFMFALVYAILTKWSFLACVLVIISSILKMTDIIPRLRKTCHKLKENKK